jgi:hypothetical protein
MNKIITSGYAKKENLSFIITSISEICKLEREKN